MNIYEKTALEEYLHDWLEGKTYDEIIDMMYDEDQSGEIPPYEFY